MKMAKLQRATLDPTKISGRCGRLKCCLRYEYDTYQDLQRELPPVGADIITNTGRARVLAQEIIAGQVLVETEEGRRVVIDASDVLTVLKRERKPQAEPSSAIEADESDEPLSEIAPDLAMLEDTVFRDKRKQPEESIGEADDVADVNGNGGEN
jgi:cell fate regulator YaaT (PSP1 superfamily)